MGIPIGIAVIEAWAAVETLLLMWFVYTSYSKLKICLKTFNYWRFFTLDFLLYVGLFVLSCIVAAASSSVLPERLLPLVLLATYLALSFFVARIFKGATKVEILLLFAYPLAAAVIMAKLNYYKQHPSNTGA